MLIDGFENPPPENRPRPFWFFNGDINKDEVRRQILEMKDKGLGGFFICARQGLRVPYLSEEWFALCEFSVDIARQNGLEVWLYDEYPYPSGMSGGEVTLRVPGAKQKILEIKVLDLCEGETVNESLGQGTLISAAAFPVKGNKTAWDKPLDLRPRSGLLQNQEIYQKTEGGVSYKHNFKRYFSYGPSRELRWQPVQGSWKLVLAFAREIDDFKYYGTFVDPANQDAVQCFIDTTHELYREKFQDELGKTVKGMFGDETSFLGRWPWSPELPAYFKDKYGYDFTENFGALADKSYPGAKQVRYHYFQCVHELLRDRYHKPLARWCEKNNIQYVTEVPSVRMSNQMYSHIPGGDPCHDKLGYPFNSVIDRDFHVLRQNPKAIGAMARQFNRRDSLVEAFHSMGWTATLQDMKWQIDRLTLMGISLHNFHAFYYTLNGITKHDAPPSQFLQNPYWEYYKTFADYCGRSSRFITETEASVSVAVLHPAIVWCTELRNPFHRFEYIGIDPEEEERGRRLIDDYRYICKVLFQHHIEYEDIDPEVMAMGRIENGTIRVGRAAYTVLVVPPVSCIEKYCFDLISRFLESGGRVIFTGLTPFDSIEEGFNPEEAFKAAGIAVLKQEHYFGAPGKAGVVKKQGGAVSLSAPGGLAASRAGLELAKLLAAFVPEKIRVVLPEQGGAAEDDLDDTAVISHRRETADARFIMLASQNGKAVDAALLFTDCPDYTVFYELDPETGTALETAAEKTKHGWLVAAPLSPWSARIFAAAKKDEKTAVPGAVHIFTQPAPKTLALALNLDRKLPVSIAGNNVFRLEKMKVRIADGKPFDSKPNTFIEHIKEAGSWPPGSIKFNDGFGIPQAVSINYPIDISYHFEFTVDGDFLSGSGQAALEIFLLRDQMGIMGNHTVLVNRMPLDAKAFKPYRVYDQNNIAADIVCFLRPGPNSIDIAVTAEKDWHGLSDPMYLIGDFGVIKSKGKFIIAKAPVLAKAGAKVVEAYPFYSGKFSFETALRAENPSGYDSFTVTLPEKYRIYECVELFVNGKSLGHRAFAPYIWQGPASLLKKGQNPVTFTIANTLGNMLEGSYYDYEKQKTVFI